MTACLIEGWLMDIRLTDSAAHDLCRMVDSPETNSLIYWSDGGDSFFGESISL